MSDASKEDLLQNRLDLSEVPGDAFVEKTSCHIGSVDGGAVLQGLPKLNIKGIYVYFELLTYFSTSLWFLFATI